MLLISRSLILTVAVLMLADCGGSEACCVPTTQPSPPVEFVAATPSTATIAVGGAVSLSAVVTDAGGNALSGRSVTWTSGNTTVASVVLGVVAGKAPGTATITAMSEGKIGTAFITVVSSAPVASVTITPAISAISVGATLHLTATTTDADGNALSDRAVSWSSNNSTVGSVSTAGIVAGIVPGSVTILATSEGKTGASVVTVNPAAFVIANRSSSNRCVEVAGGVAVVGATVTLASCTDGPVQQLRWYAPGPIRFGALCVSVAPFSAAVDAPVLAACTDQRWTTNAAGEIRWTDGRCLDMNLSAGPALIVWPCWGGANQAWDVRAPRCTSNCTPIPVSTIAVTLASSTLSVGQTIQATATLRDAAGAALTDRQVQWASSVPAVASVGAAGVVTALTPGTSTITATSEGKTGSAAVTVSSASGPTMAINAGNNQSAPVRATLSTAPSVIIRNAAGAGVNGVTVVFAIGSGGGSITGAAQTTNASGIATVGGWTLGAVAGTNTLTATATGIAGSPVTFTARGTAGSGSPLRIVANQAVAGVIDLNGGIQSHLDPVTLVATGGSVLSGYTWTVTSLQPLPHPSIFITPLGVVNGRSTTFVRGLYTMYVTVRDDAGTSVNGSIAVDLTSTCGPSNLNPCPYGAVTTQHRDYFPSAKVGADYAATIFAAGGTPPYRWTLWTLFGKLPPGLVIDPATGVLRGIPTVVGTFDFYVKVDDNAGGSNVAEINAGVLFAQFHLTVVP